MQRPAYPPPPPPAVISWPFKARRNPGQPIPLHSPINGSFTGHYLTSREPSFDDLYVTLPIAQVRHPNAIRVLPVQPVQPTILEPIITVSSKRKVQNGCCTIM